MNTVILAALGWGEWAVIGLVAIVIFGRNLPSVARNLGTSIVEFKKGLREAEKVGEPEKLSDEKEEPKK